MKKLEAISPAATEAFLLDQKRVTKHITEIRGFETLGAAAGTIAALLADNRSKLAERLIEEIKRAQNK
jgi:hypothetical protein